MTNHDLHILFVLENYYPNIGGVETLFKNLEKSLADQSIKLSIITTKLTKDSPSHESYGSVNIYRYNFINRYFFSFLALFPILRKGAKATFIHTTSYNAGLPAIFAGMILRKKVIISFHEVWGKLWFELPFMNKLGKYGHYLFEKLLLKLPFYKFVAVSEFTQSQLQKNGIKASRISLIKNGIDYNDIATALNSFQSADTLDHNKYCFFGRLGISKGLEILLPAWQKFHAKNPETNLHLILPKEPAGFLNKIKKEINRLDIQSSIQMSHNLPFPQLLNQIKNSHAVIIPSHSEGFCFAAVETMAIGTPIVSSGRGALSEVIGGQFVEMETFDEDGLFEALQKAQKNKWTHKELNKYPLESTTNAYIRLYELTASHESNNS